MEFQSGEWTNYGAKRERLPNPVNILSNDFPEVHMRKKGSDSNEPYTTRGAGG